MTDEGKSKKNDHTGKGNNQRSQKAGIKKIRSNHLNYKPEERFGKSFDFKKYDSYINSTGHKNTKQPGD